MVCAVARLRPNMKREVGVRKQYIGKIVLFCEGTTEYNYFNHFAKIINCNDSNKYTHIKMELMKADGNAKTVFNYAESFLYEEENSSKYNIYEKYLVFDCDDPPEIQEVINEMMNSKNEYGLLLTNYLFELWMLMHFEIVDEPLRKSMIYKRLCDKLGIETYKSKQKSSEGIIRQMIGDGQNVKNAIKNAKILEKMYDGKGLNIRTDIHKMNPFTSVHKLVEKILLEI